MPKKKNKGNKLARMSDEERARYLQHRAELELEAKRRKQQLIAVFTKYKLKREEAFSLLNTAKINEQWRYILRKIKCQQLYQDVENISNTFNEKINVKNYLISKLYNELEVNDLDHTNSQQTHIDIMDRLLKEHHQRVSCMHVTYLNDFDCIRSDETIDQEKLKRNMLENCKTVDAALISWQTIVRETLIETKMNNSAHIRGIADLRNKTVSKMMEKIVDGIEKLCIELDMIMSNYNDKTDKNRQYEQLLIEETNCRDMIEEYCHLYFHLQDSIDKLKLEGQDLSIKRANTVFQLYRQNDHMINHIYKLKQAIEFNRGMDAKQLKKLSVVAKNVVEDLQESMSKCTMLQSLWKMCSTLEPLAMPIKNYFLNIDEVIPSNEYQLNEPYNKLDKFWKKYNFVKSYNFMLKKELHQLTLQNKQLKNALRANLII